MKKKALLKRAASRTRVAPVKRVAAKKPARARAAPQSLVTSAATHLNPAAAGAFQVPQLGAGESYAGILLDQAGKPVAHLVEIARRTQEGTWQEQLDWAKSVGGELPNKQEGALLYANRSHAYEKRWHWLREEYAGNAVYAWVQTFGDGGQDGDHKGGRYLACAVRRVAI